MKPVSLQVRMLCDAILVGLEPVDDDDKCGLKLSNKAIYLKRDPSFAREASLIYKEMISLMHLVLQSMHGVDYKMMAIKVY